jgi:hypothetical protein
MKNKFYAIIPAEVRYNDQLTPNAKLLFGEISALCNDKGFCWANNKYFSELYNVSRTSISKWINQLKKNDYIEISYNPKEEHYRKISLNPLHISSNPLHISSKGVLTKVQTPLKQKFKHNNTVNNTINKKKEKSEKDFSDLILNCYNHLIKIFPERNRPANKKQKIKWLEVIEIAQRKDKINPRQFFAICKRAREDEFWSQNFFSIMDIRGKKNGVSKLDRFIEKFGKDIT